MRVNVPSHNTYVTFPDGTPHDMIDKVLREQFGTKKSPEPVKTSETPTEAPISPVVEPEAKVDSETLTIPDDLMITAEAVTDNGKVVKYKANAKEVMKDVEERLTLYGKMMEALG